MPTEAVVQRPEVSNSMMQLDNIMQPDLVLPSQYFGPRRPRAPEQRLMMAVLQDALHCFRKHCSATDGDGRRLFAEEQRWFLAGDTGWPYSFESICEALDLDSNAVRRRLRLALRPPTTSPPAKRAGRRAKALDCETEGVAPTVFVVDDDHGVLRALRALLGSVGLAVETYASTEEFLAAYDPRRPGCLLLDVRLPEGNGLDLQDELCRRKAALPIIVLTGHGDAQTAARASKAGAFDFLHKPAPPSLLLERIAAAIDFDREARAATHTPAPRRGRTR